MLAKISSFEATSRTRDSWTRVCMGGWGVGGVGEGARSFGSFAQFVFCVDLFPKRVCSSSPSDSESLLHYTTILSFLSREGGRGGGDSDSAPITPCAALNVLSFLRKDSAICGSVALAT